MRSPHFFSTYVTSLERVSFSRDLLSEGVPDLLKDKARDNSENVTVYKMFYKVKSRTVAGFIVKPKGVSKRKPLPVIIFNRGGSGDFGMIDHRMVFTVLAKYARWGYVVFASQYSGNDGGGGKDEYGGEDREDVKALYKLIKDMPEADEKRIGMVGGSRGGMMTYLLLTEVNWIKAAVCVGAPTDLERSEQFQPELRERQIYKKRFGGSKKEKRKRSALYWADKISSKAPLLIMHGTADRRVSPLDSLDLSRELLKHKKPHRLILFEGGDHIIREFMEEKNEHTERWLTKYVRDGEQLPNVRPHGF